MECEAFNSESGQKFLALIRAVFKVSDMMPDVVMREKIKDQTLIVFRNFSENKSAEMIKEIDALEGLLFLAGRMNFIKENHLKILENGFLILKSRVVLAMNKSSKSISESTLAAVKPVKEDVVDKTSKPEPETAPIVNKRREKIMKYFQEKNEAKLSDILEIFSGVSEKTVRNDLNDLIAIKKIVRIGSRGSGSFYKVVR